MIVIRLHRRGAAVSAAPEADETFAAWGLSEMGIQTLRRARTRRCR